MKLKKTVTPDFVKQFIIDVKQVNSPCTAFMEKIHIVPSKEVLNSFKQLFF